MILLLVSVFRLPVSVATPACLLLLSAIARLFLESCEDASAWPCVGALALPWRRLGWRPGPGRLLQSGFCHSSANGGSGSEGCAPQSGGSLRLRAETDERNAEAKDDLARLGTLQER